ncbi:MAG: hypothetical protein M1812_000912 [Candelaria pacifica]|nr:MAG: hypothetical protein M1812_000912 [Candelaria pacifica]
MRYFNDFEDVFEFDPNYKYDQKTVDKVKGNRRSLENELFFDKLLEVLAVDEGIKLYPPQSNDELRRLHRTIIASSSPDHHKQSLLYYILKDCRTSQDATGSFVEHFHLPEKYRTYMDGLWEMDRMHFANALEFLTQPSLIPTFPDKILYTLIRHAPKDDFELPLAYYNTVSVPLGSAKCLEAYFSILSRVNVCEAFYFARAQGGNSHMLLLEQLISSVLSGPSGETRAKRGVQLTNLPFNKEEEHCFEEYLLRGRGRTHNAAKDTVMMRRIATGRLQAALKDGGTLSGRKIDGLNWDSLRNGIQSGLGPRTSIEGYNGQ